MIRGKLYQMKKSDTNSNDTLEIKMNTEYNEDIN